MIHIPRSICSVLAAVLGLAQAALADTSAAALQTAGVPAKSSGVQVHHRIEQGPHAGQVRVILSLTGVTHPAGATLVYSVTGQAKILMQDATPLPTGRMSRREVTLEVEPTAPALLNVFARQNGRVGVVSIPLGEGVTLRKSAVGGLKQGASGEPLVILPAQTRPGPSIQPGR